MAVWERRMEPKNIEGRAGALLPLPDQPFTKRPRNKGSGNDPQNDLHLGGSPRFPPSTIGDKKMSLVEILLLLMIVGVVLWLINAYVPMAGSIKSILNALVVIVVIVWLLKVFGVVTTIPRVRIG
jgi:hypothetical protein